MMYTAQNINERNAESVIMNHWRHISRDTRTCSNCGEWEMDDGDDNVDICSSLRDENSGMERCTCQKTVTKAWLETTAIEAVVKARNCKEELSFLE